MTPIPAHPTAVAIAAMVEAAGRGLSFSMFMLAASFAPGLSFLTGDGTNFSLRINDR
jgi:hypothetical protein